LEDEKLRPTGSRQSLPRSTDGTDDVQESVIILLPAFNGAAHIGAQLQSIADQSFRAWQLWVADDGSTDATIDIVDRFARAHSQTVRCLAGPRKGVTANALGLLTTPDLPSGTAIAFCDQDDVWHPQKLERALSTLAKQNGPALYCSRTEIGLDPDGPLRRSPDWNRPPSFTNALVQSIAGANTMVLNAEAVAIARKAARGPLPAFHDWWLYQVVTGVGGTVCFDREPTVFYRQHEQNILGQNRSIAARYARAATLWRGHYHHWITSNLRALSSAEEMLTEENQLLLRGFRHLRRKRGLSAAREWRRLGLHRQSSLESMIIAILCTMGRI
jgi:glycosyltransferase involved in cell wall biosynthesis